MHAVRRDLHVRGEAGPAHRLRAHNTLFWKTHHIVLRPGEHAKFTAINRDRHDLVRPALHARRVSALSHVRARVRKIPTSQVPNPKSKPPERFGTGIWSLGFGIWDLLTSPSTPRSRVTRNSGNGLAPGRVGRAARHPGDRRLRRIQRPRLGRHVRRRPASPVLNVMPFPGGPPTISTRLADELLEVPCRSGDSGPPPVVLQKIELPGADAVARDAAVQTGSLSAHPCPPESVAWAKPADPD